MKTISMEKKEYKGKKKSLVESWNIVTHQNRFKMIDGNRIHLCKILRSTMPEGNKLIGDTKQPKRNRPMAWNNAVDYI